MKGWLLILLMLGSALPASAERVWMVIGASDPTAAGIARKAHGLSGGEALIVQTRDCGDKEKLFAWAASIEPTSESARAKLSKVRETAPDAYLKSCEVRPGSLLSYRITAVDPSIAEVPGSAVNWEEKARITTIKALSAGRALVIVRYFEQGANDPLEGRRERVMLADPSRKLKQLERNCISAGKIQERDGYVALQCAREQAANDLLHSVVVFDGEGNRVKEVKRCRNPEFRGAKVLQCDAESIASDGITKLKRVTVHLP
jgi:hypothetical protein